LAGRGTMEKISIEEAMKNIEYNHMLAQKYPDKQKEFAGEYMYSNPNDYKEMVELYSFYGYQYSRSLWAYQQVVYQEADKESKRRLQND